MTDYHVWLWTIGVGMPLWIIITVLFWRRTQTSAWSRFVACLFLAAIVTPIGTNNGHSAAWVFSVFYLLGVGLTSGDTIEFFWGLKIAGIVILFAALAFFWVWSWILYFANGARNKKSAYDL